MSKERFGINTYFTPGSNPGAPLKRGEFYGVMDLILKKIEEESGSAGDFDTIDSVTPGIGVTVDGVLMKDGLVDGINISASIDQLLKTTDSPSFIGLTLSGLTPGSILFTGVGGVISEDNAGLFWDSANEILGIGIAVPDASAKVDITSTDGGVLVSRMTTVEKLLIVAPATSLILFDTNTQQHEFFKTTWQAISPYRLSTGDDSVVPNTGNNVASGEFSSVRGGQEAVMARFAEQGHSSGRFGTDAGSSQNSKLVAFGETGDATPTEIFLDGIGEQLTVGLDRTIGFVIRVAARQIGGTAGEFGDSAYINHQGLIKNVEGITTFVSSTNVLGISESGSSAWTIVTTTEGGNLVMKVTGQADKTIRWTANIELTEIFGEEE